MNGNRGRPGQKLAAVAELIQLRQNLDDRILRNVFDERIVDTRIDGQPCRKLRIIAVRKSCIGVASLSRSS